MPQRRRVAQHEKAIAGTNVKAKQETVKPVSAVEQDLAIVGVSLTPEQEAAADAIQEKYLGRLRSLNRGIRASTTDWCRWKRTSSWRSRRFSRKIKCSNCVRFARVHRPPCRLKTAANSDAAQTK